MAGTEHQPSLLKPALADNRSHSSLLQAILVLAAIHVVATSTVEVYNAIQEKDWLGWNQVVLLVSYIASSIIGYAFLLAISAGNTPVADKNGKPTVSILGVIVSVSVLVAYVFALGAYSLIEDFKLEAPNVETLMIYLMLPIALMAVILYILILVGCDVNARKSRIEAGDHDDDDEEDESAWAGLCRFFTVLSYDYPPLLLGGLILSFLTVTVILAVLWHAPDAADEGLQTLIEDVQRVRRDLASVIGREDNDADEYLKYSEDFLNYLKNNAPGALSGAFFVSAVSALGHLYHAASEYTAARIKQEHHLSAGAHSKKHAKSARLIGSFIAFTAFHVCLTYLISAVLGLVSFSFNWVENHVLGLVCYLILIVVYYFVEAINSPTLLSALSLVSIALAPYALVLRLFSVVFRLFLGGSLHVGEEDDIACYFSLGYYSKLPTSIKVLAHNDVASSRAAKSQGRTDVDQHDEEDASQRLMDESSRDGLDNLENGPDEEKHQRTL